VNAFAENLAAYFQAVERMARWTQASAIFGIVSSLVGVAMLVSTNSIVAFSWGFVAGWVCALGWLLVGLPPEVRRSRSSAAPIAEVGKGLAPFAVAFIGIAIYCKVDVLLIERWSGTVQAGVYTAAYKVVDIFQALVVVAAGAVYPRLSRSATDGSGPSLGGQRATELLLLGAVPVGLGLFLLSTPAVSVLYGEDYAASGPVVARLALLLPLLSVSILGGYVLGAVGRMDVVALLYGVAVAINVALNAWLIPTMGAEGAALARLGSESLLLVAFVYALGRYARAAPTRVAWVVAGGCGVVAALVSRMPDPTGGWLRAAVFLVTTLVIYERAGAWTSAGVVRLWGALDWTARRRSAQAESA
jgi:O-antigen/teichoic acid export membrane protein